MAARGPFPPSPFGSPPHPFPPLPPHADPAEGRGIFGRQPRGRRPEGRVVSSAVGRHGGNGSGSGRRRRRQRRRVAPLPTHSPPSPWRFGGGKGRLRPATTGTMAGGEGGVSGGGEAFGQRIRRRRWERAADPASGAGDDNGSGGSGLPASGSVAGDRGSDGDGGGGLIRDCGEESG
uniref:Uncharacterized protein n=1 Tax=Oryza glumipatula TaxID=40148 RepID=A0A0E0AAA0_9ORYZ